MYEAQELTAYHVDHHIRSANIMKHLYNRSMTFIIKIIIINLDERKSFSLSLLCHDWAMYEAQELKAYHVDHHIRSASIYGPSLQSFHDIH
jgi:tRNA(Ile)-lysidine synthase TilS/MesJ